MTHPEDKQCQAQAQPQSYISPSDTIMSPTTKKLSEMKGKRFASGKPQSLFAKTVGRQIQTNGQAQAQAQAQGQAEAETRAQAQGQGQIQSQKGRDGGGGEGEENSIADSKTEAAKEEQSRQGLAGAKEMR
ncbi:hypothetical protein EPUS_04037 [Endocarpon pusillum Z07020]|uniref:Uncharacterized protein n=1 Tax=Endocarpon pusillum (strain Z07020 / HMAS-L-300199) TaxID=1263415 RepID=U1FWU3_ENDPU|nr:uncharacterized protein EPUS_04037 [Endocarpon pusillum Z07020]ERF69332.1 hypothetical protein EPUS_04037 [Endocarpon pusillum Z07020]